MSKFFHYLRGQLWGQMLLMPIIFLTVSLVPYLLVSGFHALRGQGITSDNIVTTGRVVTVGQSVVTNGPSVIGFGYKVPGNTHQPWSYEREHKVEPADLAKFRVGQNVQIEYSRSIPGMARLRGYGRTSSVYLDSTLEDMASSMRIILPVFALGILIQWIINRWRQNRKPKPPLLAANP